jgi:hypothetical protein
VIIVAEAASHEVRAATPLPERAGGVRPRAAIGRVVGGASDITPESAHRGEP